MTAGLEREPAAVALLGFGEAGTAIAEGLCGSAWRRAADAAGKRRVQAVDTALGRGARGGHMAQRAAALGVEIAPGYGPALATTDVVISVVTCAAAREAAAAARPFLRPGTLYLDCNSVTGAETRALAAHLAEAGVAAVDVAVMGGFKAFGQGVPLLLSGPPAASAAAWMNRSGFRARVLNARLGDASAVKILRSILTKGIEALAVECLVAAQRQDLVAELLDSLGDIDEMGFARFLEYMAVTHPVHAERRTEEVELAARNLRETGVEPILTEAIRRAHARTAAAGVAPADGALLPLDEALRLLGERAVGYPGARDER